MPSEGIGSGSSPDEPTIWLWPNGSRHRASTAGNAGSSPASQSSCCRVVQWQDAWL